MTTVSEPREKVEDLLIQEEMKKSYLLFAMSVIVSRALPDVRDGLKPSQRRLLVTMHDLGLGPRSKFRKCSKIAGDTFGNYHPLGEESLYPTLVRMAQDWVLRYPLVEGQGNFGSMDGDPPAAQRYTEARMTSATTEMMEDIDKDTVDFVPNYDETRTEPTVLPAKFPNLLCNGCTGIAVGMATSIPPHNLGEVIDATVRLIDNPEASVEELMEIVRGPDFPTGGLICGRKAIRQAYRDGRSILKIRARAHVESAAGGKKSVVVTEVPYQVNRDSILEEAAKLVKKGRIDGIADLRNESNDREGTRLVFELKRGAEEKVVLNQLYKYTSLETQMSVISIALVNRKPETLNLKELLTCFLEHRFEVIRRRTAHLLVRARARLHIVEGLRIAVANIDAIIQLIKRSKDVNSARQGLMDKFGLTEIQSQAILDMRLQRLTGLERIKIEQEYAELKKQIAEYEAVLADDRRVYGMIRKDLAEIKERYGDPRRTDIVDDVEELDVEDLIAEESVTVIISHDGYIKRIPVSQYRKQRRGGTGVAGAETKEGDVISHIFVASTHDYILIFTDAGRVHWQKVYDLPSLGRASRGRAIVNLLQLQRGENVTSMIPIREFGNQQLIMATAKGRIKKTPVKSYSHPKKTGIIAIKLEKGDRLVGVSVADAKQDIFLATKKGMAIRFSEAQIRSMGRNTRGVRGIRLRAGDSVVAMAMVDDTATALAVCANGFGKRTAFPQYKRQGRGGLGVINIRTSRRNGDVVDVLSVRQDDEAVMVTSEGMIIRMPVKTIRTTGRSAQGVKLIRLKPRDKVVSTARIVPEDEPPKEAESPPAPGEPSPQVPATEQAPPQEAAATGKKKEKRGKRRRLAPKKAARSRERAAPRRRKK